MRRLAAALGLVLAAVAVLLPTAARAASVPEPADDPFYAVPANVATYAPGAVIDSRQITALAYVLPVPADTWQIKYRTNDSHGNATATVTTLMVPHTAWAGAGTRPMVSYQPAEDGVGDQCAPSYALRAGMLDAHTNSSYESVFLLAGLGSNWAVTVPDYEGPQSQFLAGRMSGQGILDGIRASLNFQQTGLPASTPVGIWGYSGGAFATSIAAQLQPTYAPELNLKAVALGGVVADINATINAFSGSSLGGAIAMGVNGPMRAFPEYNLGQYLSDAGKQKVAAASDDCMSDAANRYPGLRISDIEAYPGALSSAPVQDLLHANSPLGVSGTPSAPVYDYHATYDEFAPTGPDRQLILGYCANGATVQHVEDPGADHISEVLTGGPGALAFLQARFGGVAPTNNCATVPKS